MRNSLYLGYRDLNEMTQDGIFCIYYRNKTFQSTYKKTVILNKKIYLLAKILKHTYYLKKGSRISGNI